MELLKKRLRQECDMVPSDTVLESFVALGTERRLREEEVVTGVGEVKSSVYVVKDGLLRMVDMNGGRERFRSLLKTRPEIIGRVRQKHIASYLGISPEYLCRLRKKMR